MDDRFFAMMQAMQSKGAADALEVARRAVRSDFQTEGRVTFSQVRCVAVAR